MKILFLIVSHLFYIPFPPLLLPPNASPFFYLLYPTFIPPIITTPVTTVLTVLELN